MKIEFNIIFLFSYSISLRYNIKTKKRNSLTKINKAIIEVRMTHLFLFCQFPCQIEQGLSNISVSVSSNAKKHKHRPRSASATASQIDPRFLSVETKRRRESIDSPNTRYKWLLELTGKNLKPFLQTKRYKGRFWLSECSQ